MRHKPLQEKATGQRTNSADGSIAMEAEKPRAMKTTWRAVLFPATVDPKYRKWSDTFMQARLKVSLLLAFISVGTFTLLNLSRYPDFDTTWLDINLTQLGMLALSVPLLFSSLARHTLALPFLLMSLAMTVPPIAWYFALDQYIKFDVVTWTLVFLTQATLLPLRWYLHLASQLLVLLAVLLVILAPGPPVGIYAPFEDRLFLLFYLLWFCIICDLSVFYHEKLQHSELTSKRFLQAERKRSEHLLRNILPDPIANRLRAGESTIADYYPQVTVLFADIVGFTRLATHLPPGQLVSLLSELFSTFDQLLVKYRVEKIKTIGDAYMAISGAPTPDPQHVENIADFALAMNEAIAVFNQQHPSPLQLRIGIHTGPVVAGVIGERKFSYDLWGDTVNTASRMETNGLPGEIQVSPEVYEILREAYQFVERGMLDIKGLGSMKTWLLKGRP